MDSKEQKEIRQLLGEQELNEVTGGSIGIAKKMFAVRDSPVECPICHQVFMVWEEYRAHLINEEIPKLGDTLTNAHQ